MTRQRIDVKQAAQILGISTDAIHKRARRGSLPSDKDPDGRVFVYLDNDLDNGYTRLDNGYTQNGDDDHVGAFPEDPRDELVATLKEQLEAERNAHAETRRIAYTLAQRVPELEAAQEPRESPEPRSGEPTPSEDAGASEEQPQRRSWLYRFFFGP